MAQTKVQLLQPDLGDVIDFDASTLFVDGADNRIGIRNTNPQYELDVTGTINATNFRGNISTGTIDDWITHTGDTNTKFGFPANDQFSVETGGSQRLLVQDAGAKVTGTLELTDALYWDGDTDTTIDNAAGTANWIRFKTGGTTVMDITSTNDLKLHDNRRLKVGASDDIQIFHNSGNNRNYFFSPQNNVYHEFNVANSWTVQTTAGDKRIECTANGTATGVDLFHNGSMKLRTTSSGVNFTGTDFGFNTTPGGNPAGKAVFLAIGDSDTGIVQDGDGQLELWANNNEVANINAIDGYLSTKPITTSNNITMGGRLIHHGDTDTYMEYADNQIDFVTGSSRRMYIQNSGIYVQSGTPLAFLASSGATPNIKSGGTNNQDLLFTSGSGNPTRLQITSGGKLLGGNQTNDRGAILQIEDSNHAQIGIHRNTADHGAPAMRFSASRGTSAGANNLVQNNDYLGMIRFEGADGSDLATGAYITGIVDGTATTDKMPTRLGLWTSDANSQSPTERLRIKSDGSVNIGNPNGYAIWNGLSSDVRVQLELRHTVGVPQGMALLEERGDSNGTNLILGKSRGGNGVGVINSGDTLGWIKFSGADGTRQHNAAGILTWNNGTVATGRVAGNLSFYTSPDAVGSLTERLRIQADGVIRFREGAVRASASGGGVDTYGSGGSINGVSTNSLEGGFLSHYTARDGSKYRRNFDIASAGDGTWGSQTRFSTHPDGGGVSKERARITHDGTWLHNSAHQTVPLTTRTQLIPYFWDRYHGVTKYIFAFSVSVTSPKLWILTARQQDMAGTIKFGFSRRTNWPTNGVGRMHNSMWRISNFGDGNDNEYSQMRENENVYQNAAGTYKVTVGSKGVDYIYQSHGGSAHPEWDDNTGKAQNYYSRWWWHFDTCPQSPAMQYHTCVCQLDMVGGWNYDGTGDNATNIYAYVED